MKFLLIHPINVLALAVLASSSALAGSVYRSPCESLEKEAAKTEAALKRCLLAATKARSTSAEDCKKEKDEHFEALKKFEACRNTY